MPEESFEQQARNIAEQFSMEPQPVVWQRVKAAIAPKRRRRAVFVWWLLLLGAACGFGFWLMNDSESIQKKHADSKQKEAKTKIHPIEKRENANEKRSGEEITHLTKNSKQSVALTQNKKRDLFVKNHLTSHEEKGIKQKKETTLFQPQTHFISDKNVVKEKDVKEERNATLVQPQTTTLVNSNKATDSNNAALQKPPTTISDTVKPHVEITVKTNDTLKQNKDSSLASINKKKGKTKWHWGLTAEGGTSWAGNGLFGDQSKSLSVFSSVPTGNFNNGSQNPSTYQQQRKNGVDAALGIAVETNLSKHWFLDGGFTYRYQEFHIQTISFSNLPTSLFGNVIKSNASYHFQSANLYTGIGLSLFHKKNTSVALQAGVDNALFLSIKQMHNDSLQALTAQGFQHWQASLQFAVPVGIYSKRKIRWQLSPFVRWGLRGLQESGNTFGHHPLNSAGIKAIYFFK